MRTVLYIEERPHVRDNLVKLLSAQMDFFKVLTANSVPEAIELIEDVKVDIVIAGKKINAVDVDSLDVCLRRHKEIRFIVMAERKSPLANMLKAFEYKIQLEVPVDLNLLMDTLFKEFDINCGGQLRGISIASFLQMIELEAKTCMIKVISRGKTGRLYCRSGEFIEAEYADLNGKEAAFALLGMDNPLIIVDYDPPEKAKTITASLMSLLLESGRMTDEKMKAVTQEKRRYKRFACSFPVEFVYNEWTYKSRISNISLNGAFLETKEPFSIGKEIQVAFHSQSLDKGCRVTGIVVRRDPDGIGIAFTAMSINQMAILRTVINETAGA